MGKDGELVSQMIGFVEGLPLERAEAWQKLCNGQIPAQSSLLGESKLAQRFADSVPEAEL